MTFYTSAVKTWTIDPVFNVSKVRSEFRLDTDKLYSSGLRLLNVGLVVDERSSRYNFMVGAQPIRRIVLYDGKTVLDSVDFHNLEGFRRYNKTNSNNCDTEKALKKHGLGFTFWRNNSDEPGPFNISVNEFDSFSDNAPTDKELDTPKAFINLREVFPMLKALSYVHTGIFKDVRIVIDYLMTDAIADDGSSLVLGTTLPVLVCDEILDPKLASSVASSFNGVSWNAIESETVLVPASDPAETSVQSKKLRLTGFTNKTLNRLFIQKQPFIPNTFYGTACSVAMIGESFRFLVNGSDLLSDKLDKPNMILGLLNDTWGTCNTHTCANNLSIYNAVNFIDGYTDRVGSLSYVGLTVAQKINDFQVEYTRETPTGTTEVYLQGIYLNFFGEVAKSLVITKTGYSINYL
jgi:hypothetical protein